MAKTLTVRGAPPGYRYILVEGQSQKSREAHLGRIAYIGNMAMASLCGRPILQGWGEHTVGYVCAACLGFWRARRQDADDAKRSSGVSHFHGAIRGDGPGIVSKRGTMNSGLEARIGAWYAGVRVVLRYEDGKDVVRIYRTGGSFGRDVNEKLLAEYHAEKAGGQPL